MQIRKDLPTIIFVAAMLLVPAMGLLFPLQFNFANLFGVNPPALPSPLTLSSYGDKTFQREFETWMNANFGARNFLVRCNNQLLYSLFRASHMNDDEICFGNQNSIFFKMCLQAQFGKEPPGFKESFERTAAKIKKLQDLANERGMAFVFIISPTKSMIETDLVPREAKKLFKGDFYRYDELVNQLKAHNVNYVDGQQITRKFKEETGLRAFTLGGLHWTFLAARPTFNAAIDVLNKQLQVPLSRIAVSNISRGRPIDAESDGADLVNKLDGRYWFDAPHGTYSAESPKLAHGRTLLMEGGSFTHQILELGFQTGVFSRVRNFYYCKEVHLRPEGAILKTTPAPFTLEKELTADVLIIEKNEGQDLADVEQYVDIMLPKFHSHLAGKTQQLIN